MQYQTLITLLALGTIALEVAAVVLFFFYVTKKDSPLFRCALPAAFAIALGGILGSLFMSEILGFDPCSLCWYQRILLYPQVIILGAALWKRTRNEITPIIASLVLSSLGAIVAAYHYYGQMFNPSALPCEVVGLTPACSQRFFVEFGYITIPMMALSTFAVLIVLLLIEKRRICARNVSTQSDSPRS